MFHDEDRMPLLGGARFQDFAVIWDEDDDERVLTPEMSICLTTRDFSHRLLVLSIARHVAARDSIDHAPNAHEFGQ